MKLIQRFLKPCPVTYHDENHTYTLNSTGKLIPGVTTITGNLDKPFLVPWAAKEAVGHLANKHEYIKSCSPDQFTALLDEAKGAHRRKSTAAADAGTKAHDWIDQYIAARIKEEPVADLPEQSEVARAVDAFLEWESRKHVIWYCGDLVVGSEEHEFGGRLDALCAIEGVPSLPDFKTSNQISKDYFLQTAGYHLALKEMGLEMWQRLILRFDKNGGGFEALVVPTPLDLDIKGFLALREVQRWQSYVGNSDHGILNDRGMVRIPKAEQPRVAA